MPDPKPTTPETPKSLLADLTLDERSQVWQQAMNETHGGNPSEALLKELIECLHKGQGQEAEPEQTEEEAEPEPEPEEEPHSRKKRRTR